MRWIVLAVLVTGCATRTIVVVPGCLAECQDESTVPRALGLTAIAVASAGLLFLIMANVGH